MGLFIGVYELLERIAMEKKTRKRTVKNKVNETMKVYRPEPVDTSDVIVPEELMGLVEEMSRNVHEVWAKSRMDQGWSWGPQRDDELKTHPDLVPYEELTEEEKDYDRDTSMQTIKLILKLGFKISK